MSNPYAIVLHTPYTSAGYLNTLEAHPDAFTVIHVLAEAEHQAGNTLYPITSLLQGWVANCTMLNLSNVLECTKHAPLQTHGPYIPVRTGHPAAGPNTTREQREQTLTAFHVCDVNQLPFGASADELELRAHYTDLVFVNFQPQPDTLALWLHHLVSFHLQYTKTLRLVAVDWVQDTTSKHRVNVTNQEPRFPLGQKG